MRNIDSAILTELAANNIRPFMLVEIELDSGFKRYTDCDVAIVDGVDRYEPRGIEISSVSYSSNNIVDSAQIKISNLDDVLTSDFVGGTPQGANVVVKMVLLNATTYQPI